MTQIGRFRASLNSPMAMKWCTKLEVAWAIVFSCDQGSTNSIFRLSVRLSVTPFWLCSHHPIIMKFSGLLPMTKVRSMQTGQPEVKGQGHRGHNPTYRFRTVTPVWIHIWWWNDAYSLMLLRRGALLFFKVICRISRSHGSKNRRMWPRLGVSGL